MSTILGFLIMACLAFTAYHFGRFMALRDVEKRLDKLDKELSGDKRPNNNK